VVRSGLVEGTHFGSAVVVDAQGKIEWSIGDVASAMFPRSSNKLMQSLAMVRNGLPLKDELLALSSASHSGEDFHLAGVQDILNAANLDTSALQCPADWPLDEIEKDTLLAAGLGKSSIYMNCSGKHSAMLFTCVLNGWDTDNYLETFHPLQLACQAAIEDVTGEKVEHIGVDGCGAPLMSTSLTGLARAFSKFAGPSADAEQKKRKQEQAQKAAQDKADEVSAETLRKENLQRMQGMAGASGGSNATGSALKSSGPSASYAGRLVGRIKPNITYPGEAIGNPRAEVEVKVNPDGTILSRRIVQSSGNKAWDDAVLRAIDKTEVFPRDSDGRVPPLMVLGFRPLD
jgi:TonB family protein